MDFSIPEATRRVLDEVDALMAEHVLPAEPRLMAAGFFSAEPELERLRDVVRGKGLWAPQVPAQLGGMGLDLVAHALVSERIGRSPFGHYVFGCHAPDAGTVEILHLHGTPEQKARWLEPLALGRIRSCFAMTEPGSAGSNPTLLECRAVRDGDEWVIDGDKWFASSADGAAFAVVMAVTDPDAHPHRRASQILVPTGTPGFELVRNVPVIGHVGEGWASHGHVRFTGCRVPAANLLGAEGAGFAIAQERLGPGRIHHCMRWLGVCDRAFELLCRRALERRIDDEDVLADKQIVRAWIAECRARIQSARWLTLQTAWTIERVGWKAASVDISLIKFLVAGVMQEVIDRAIQVHGAAGLTDQTVLSYFYAAERAARIYDGPDEVHKLAAARRILRAFEGGGRR